MVGNEYCTATINGGKGDSFKVNTKTGAWAEFNGSTGQRGGDLISLFSSQQNLSQGEAARKLAGRHNYRLDVEGSLNGNGHLPQPEPADLPPTIPPPDAPQPDFGSPAKVYEYRNAENQLLFYVARYETSTGKTFVPYSWIGGEWRKKSWPSPRPLYGLERLAAALGKAVVVCEGEKATEAAIAILGMSYVPVCWPNGAQAVGKADFNPLAGRKVLLWPDADEPGKKAMVSVAEILSKIEPKCPEIKIINPDGQPKGWDAADALKDGWDKNRLVGWVRGENRVSVYPQAEPEPAPAEPQAATITSISEPAIIDPRTLGLATKNKGGFFNNMDNLVRILDKSDFLRGRIWWDEFSKRIKTSMWCKPGIEGRDFEEPDAGRFLMMFQRKMQLPDTKKNAVWEAIDYYAHEDTRNEPKEWLESLEWDRVDRLTTFCEKYLAVKPSKFASQTGKNFLVSLVARIYEPGCQVDTMPVLEGEEGKRKSKALKILGSPWYYNCRLGIDQKRDFEEALQGKWLIEMSEMEAFRKAEITTMKQILSCQTDRFRAAYGRLSADYPRCCVFAGTTNETDYLPQGKARRFYPWESTGQECDYHGLEEAKPQLFAQAVALYKSQIGQPDSPEHPGHWWYVDEGAHQELVSARQVHDSWEGPVRRWITEFQRTDGAELDLIAKEALEIPVSRFNRSEQIRLGKVLREIGWKKKHTRRGGVQTWVWLPADDIPPF